MKNSEFLKQFKLLTREEMKKVIGGDWDVGLCNSRPPGGNNGDPCPQYCEPSGGIIVCLGTINGTPYVYDTNCNQHPYNPNLHNKCLNSATGDFWC